MKQIVNSFLTVALFCLFLGSCKKDHAASREGTDSTPGYILGKWEAYSVMVRYWNEAGEELQGEPPFYYGQGRLVLTFDDAGKYTTRQGDVFFSGMYKVEGNKIIRDGSVSELAVSGNTMHFTDLGDDVQQGATIHWKSTLELHKIE